MRVSSVCVLLIAAILMSACATRHQLKMPCELPDSALSYGPDDCGPLLPVNEALKNIITQPPHPISSVPLSH